MQYTRFPAVDGAALHFEQLPLPLKLRGFKLLHAGEGMTPGAIGCFLSHLNLWKQIVQQQTPYAVILEDDVILQSDFAEVVQALTKTQWYFDIVRLSAYGVSADMVRSGYYDTPPATHAASDLLWKKVRKTLEPIGKRFLVQYKKPVLDTAAYIITRAGAEKLLQQCVAIKEPVDHAYERWYANNTYFFGVHLPVACQQRLLPQAPDGCSVQDEGSIEHERQLLEQRMASRAGYRYSRRLRKLYSRLTRYRYYWHSLLHPPKKWR